MSDVGPIHTVPKLNAIQRRVFGVLIEKSLTTPGGYPMTMNSLLTGCNQLTCREPVMQLSEGEIARALHELQIMGNPLVRQAEVDRTARANRFEHLAEQRFGWDRRERAIMAELLLRGPQTAGELKTNGSRMAPFDDLPGVLSLLTELGCHEPPYVRELPRQPGRSTVRYDHLLYAEPRTEGESQVGGGGGAIHASNASAAMSASGSAAGGQAASGSAAADSAGTRSGVATDQPDLAARVADLEARLARLEADFAAGRRP